MDLNLGIKKNILDNYLCEYLDYKAKSKILFKASFGAFMFPLPSRQKGPFSSKILNPPRSAIVFPRTVVIHLLHVLYLRGAASPE